MSPERARLFVALELPEPVPDVLLAWRQSALGDGRAWRPVEAAALHLTLCFLGDQPVEEIAPIAHACAAALSEGDDPALGAPVLTLAAPLLLGPPRARALAVALEDPGKALAVVQGRLAHGLAAGGWYEPESRPYLAHVTPGPGHARGPGARGAGLSGSAGPHLRTDDNLAAALASGGSGCAL